MKKKIHPVLIRKEHIRILRLIGGQKLAMQLKVIKVMTASRKKCKKISYYCVAFHCCLCAEEAMKKCGVSVSENVWPHWPVTPVPQRGEYKYALEKEY